MASQPFPDLRRGTWRMKYRPDPTGDWVTITLGKDARLKGARPPKTPPQSILDRARELEDAEYRAKVGLKRAAPARPRGLEDYLTAYVETLPARVKAGSAEKITHQVGLFLAYCEGRGVTTLQAITQDVCRDYLEARMMTVKPTTAKSGRGHIIAIFTRAEEEGLIPSNPWKFARMKRKVVPPEPTYWTADEIARIVEACRKPHLRDATLILANTGIRLSTVAALPWSWIDWQDGVVRIGEGEGVKTNYNHVLGRVARAVLERRRFLSGGSSYVFPNPKGEDAPLYSHTLQYAVTRAINRAGVRKGHPHDLRHSYARALILSGVPVTVVQSQLGHTTLELTMRYVRTGEKEARGFVGDFGVGEAKADESKSP